MKERKRLKCNFEDEGKCKFGKTCTREHPQRVCHSHSKDGKCHKRSQCEYRHPLNTCFQWKKEAFCHRGDSCRFRHPQEYSKKDFLEKGKSQPPNQRPIQSPIQPSNQVPSQYQMPPPMTSYWPPLIQSLQMYHKNLPMNQGMNLYPQWYQQTTTKM